MSWWGSAVLAAVVASSWIAGCATQRKTQKPAVPKPPMSAQPSTPASPASPAAPLPTSSSKEAESPAQEKAAAKTPPSHGGAGTVPTPGPAPSPTDPGSASASDPGKTDGSKGGGAGARGAQTPDEQREVLDRHLDASLAQFDAMLLKEQQELAAKRAEQAAAGGAGSEGSEGEGGSGSGTGAASGATAQKAGSSGARAESQRAGQDKKGGRTKDESTGASQGGSREGNGREVTTAPEGTPPGPGDSTLVPVDVGDGRDDDVVARQLREAAMKERDPAIREKLWDEYRKYKRGGS